MLIGQLRKRENLRERARQPIRHSLNAKLVILVREQSRLRLARPANVASCVLKSCPSYANQINEHASVLWLDLKGINVSLTTFEDVKYVKHLYIFLSFSKSRRSQFFLVPYFYVTYLRYSVQQVALFAILVFDRRACAWANLTGLAGFVTRAFICKRV